MIISSGRRYIFVHIPKTGGTSMALALEARAKADDILIGDTPKAQRRKRRLKDVQTVGRLWKHSTLRDAGGLITQHEMEAFYVFTLVRNPWDRVVSYYHWLLDQSFDHPAVRLAQQTDFATFVSHPQTQASLAAERYGSYVQDVRGREHCNLFIRLEHLSKDVLPLEAHLGFSLQDMPRSNVSGRQVDYRTYYTDDSAALIAGFCREDITRFGYGFDDPALLC